MDVLFYIIISLVVGSSSMLLTSMRIVNEGNEALVERLGRYHTKLSAGVNFVLPFLDSIVVEETTREKVLGIEPQNAISKDNVSLKIDAVIYWQILDLEKAFYAVEDIKDAIENLVVTTLRSEIGQLDLDETYSSRESINRKLLHQLDEATGNWGVKVTRIEVREIALSKTVMDSLEVERAAESKKKAAILETQGTVQSIQMISEALQNQPNAQEVLTYLIAQRYVDANEKLGTSPNTKVLFMDPKALHEAMNDLMSGGDRPSPNSNSNGSNGQSSSPPSNPPSA
ncbi:stomatin-like protein [Spirulina sp. 06S082]|uniref:SPFH domain-containing protein n=1 Tax=Spirulina sp. 06S082 TaxID=3110248 RepID=UPI002B206674|nr:stomatin-like protein [Spirulina sp. 06S082]MEA5468933.1 stomatin-like protein [Spirulina sp. 06S082]